MLAQLRRGEAERRDRQRRPDRGGRPARSGRRQSISMTARVFEPQAGRRRSTRRQAVLRATIDALLDRSRDAAVPLQRRPVPRLAADRRRWRSGSRCKLADRLVRPVGELVDAARRVTAGDLSARVPASRVERRGRHARQRLQPDDPAARGADRRPGRGQRPARQPPRLHRGGAVGRHRRRHLGRSTTASSG